MRRLPFARDSQLKLLGSGVTADVYSFDTDAGPSGAERTSADDQRVLKIFHERFRSQAYHEAKVLQTVLHRNCCGRIETVLEEGDEVALLLEGLTCTLRRAMTITGSALQGRFSASRWCRCALLTVPWCFALPGQLCY